jgi:predicted GNAT family acetyltransferase
MEIRISPRPAGVPGCYFHEAVYDRDAQYFTVYIEDFPVGQMAILRRGRLWWIDYLYIQQEFRGGGIVRALVKEVLPAAAKLTDYVWEQCEGATPEDLARNSKRYSLKIDILRTYQLGDKPCTLTRRHIAPLRQTP